MTSTLTEVLDRVWPVVVVGAGPAGAVVARELARRGIEVLLVERAPWPRPKVCGGCLNGQAIQALEAVGLGGVLEQQGAVPLRSLTLAARGQSAQVPLPTGVSLSRQAFDAALVDAAIRAGVQFLPLTTASLTAQTVSSATTRAATLRQSHAEGIVHARLVLLASGLGSLENRISTGSRVGIGTVLPSMESFYQPGTIYMNCAREGYLGVVRVEADQLDLAGAIDPAALRSTRSPAALARRILTAASWPIPAHLDEASWRGTPALTRQARVIAGHRFFALGDATGYVEPFTGEGIAWALRSALAVTDLALLAVTRWSDELATRWTQRHHREIRRSQRLCRLAALTLRQPWLVAFVARSLQFVPWLARPVVQRLNQRPAPLAGW